MKIEMKSAVEVRGLQKSYGSHVVLKGLHFHIRTGEIFALLGVNGAGKTTTLECIEGLREYDEGTITVNGTMGIQLQSSSLPAHIKPMEAVRLFAVWNRVTPDRSMLNALGIKEIEKKQYFQLSTGQKRRLHLALALISSPDILFLDEPTAGLDVEGRRSLHSQIRALKAQGENHRTGKPRYGRGGNSLRQNCYFKGRRTCILRHPFPAHRSGGQTVYHTAENKTRHKNP